MRIFLVSEELQVEVREGTTFMGRGLDCEIRFNDPFLSRHHVIIRRAGGSVTAEDAGSRNGTLVNSKPVHAPTPLLDGDKLQVGCYTLQLTISEQPVPERRADEPEEPFESTLGKFKIPTTGRSAEAPPPEIGDVGLPSYHLHNCKSCRAMVPSDAERCPKCGAEFPRERPMAVTPVFGLSLEATLREAGAALKSPVDIPVLYASDELIFDAVVSQLTAEGVLITTELLDKVDATCTLTMLPEGGPPISCAGLVISAENNVLGVRFTKMSESARRWIVRFMERRAGIEEMDLPA